MAIVVPVKYRKYGWAALAVLVLYIGVRFWANIPAYDSKKMGEYAAAKTAAYKLKAELTKANDILTVRIAEKDKLLAAKTDTIARKDTIINGLGARQSELEAEYVTLKNCDSRLVNLTLQVVNLEDTIKVKDGIISDKDDMIFLLTAQKFDALAGWENTKKMLSAAEAQANACDAVRKQLARDLKIKQLTGTVKTGIVLAAAGYVLYGALKK
jgi:hypothetical protein